MIGTIRRRLAADPRSRLMQLREDNGPPGSYQLACRVSTDKRPAVTDQPLA